MTQYVSALELATYFNGTTDLADLEPEWIAQADLLLEMISADVEAAAGIPIEAGSGTVVLAGTWDRDIELPAGPVRDVSAVTLNGVALASGEWWWNERSLLRRGADLFVEHDDAAVIETAGDELSTQGAQHRSGHSWGGPASTVTVAYTWGFSEVPGIVRALVLRIAARTFGNVAQLTQETLAVYSVSYGQSTNTNDGSHVTAAERKRLRKILNRSGGTIAAGSR